VFTEHNADERNAVDEWTSIGQTDCVVDGMQARECDAYAETTRLLHSENVGVEAIGCAATASVLDRSTVTFIKNSEQELANRSLTAWLRLEPWGFVCSVLASVDLSCNQKSDCISLCITRSPFDCISWCVATLNFK
jgi:hypothetical protein